MNAGMFGAPDGIGMAGRKFAGRVSRSARVTAPAATFVPVPGSFGFASPTGLTVTANAKTLVASFSGMGALRWLHVTNSAGATAAIALEVVVDGVSSVASMASVAASGVGFVALGTLQSTATDTAAIPDFVPFDKSLELYVTTSQTQVTPFYVVDIHQ